MKDLENTNSIFLNILNLDLKSMSPAVRKAFFMNVLFPGMGFFYAGNLGLGFLLGFGAILLVCLGMVIIPQSFPAYVVLAMLMFALAVIGHFLAIFMTPNIHVKKESALTAYIFVAVSLIFIAASFIFCMIIAWTTIPYGY